MPTSLEDLYVALICDVHTVQRRLQRADEEAIVNLDDLRIVGTLGRMERCIEQLGELTGADPPAIPPVVKYTLVGSKPDSADYCRGCLMDSYSSDFVMERGLARRDLVLRIADLRLRPLGQGEVGWDVRYFIDGPVDLDDENEDDSSIDAEVAFEVERQRQARIVAHAECERQAKLEAQKAKVAADLATLARLQAEYGAGSRGG